MHIVKKALIASAVSAAALLAASAASAQENYNVTDVNLTPSPYQQLSLSGTVANYGAFSSTEYAGLITLTTQNGVIPTFCVDLFHTINLGGSYSYTTAPLTVDSSDTSKGGGLGGNPLTATQVAEIYSLADTGVQAYKAGTGTGNEYVALQGAIWAIEYPDLTVTSSDPTVTAAIDAYVANPGMSSAGIGLIPGMNGVGSGAGQALVTAPGPHMGEGLLGFAAMTALLLGARYRGLFV